jgi:hypothetical protein
MIWIVAKRPATPALVLAWCGKGFFEIVLSLKPLKNLRGFGPNNIMVDLEADPLIVKVVDFGLIQSEKRSTLVPKQAQHWSEMDTVQVECCKQAG